MGRDALVTCLYRSLLKHASAFDKGGPPLTSLVHRSFDGSTSSLYFDDESLAHRQHLVANRYCSFLSMYLGGDRKVLLGPEESRMLNVRRIVKEAFRDEYPDKDVAIDVGFSALRELTTKQKWGEVLGALDGTGRVKRPVAPPRSSHAMPGGIGGVVRKVKREEANKPGTFLISHPLLGNYFSRTVVLLSSETPLGNTEGLIVNEPHQLKEYKQDVKQVFEIGGLHGDLAQFFQNNTKIGGPKLLSHYDPMNSVIMLHRCDPSDSNMKNVGGCLIPSLVKRDDQSEKSVYIHGDIGMAVQNVEKGVASEKDMAFSSGVIMWKPGQLEAELEWGFWIPCAAPPELIFETDGDGRFAGSGRDMWSTMLSEIGYTDFARFPVDAKVKIRNLTGNAEHGVVADHVDVAEGQRVESIQMHEGEDNVDAEGLDYPSDWNVL